jgi:hypothetical protein
VTFRPKARVFKGKVQQLGIRKKNMEWAIKNKNTLEEKFDFA